MDAKLLLFDSFIIVLFLAIGIWTMRLNNRRLLAVIAGLMGGGLLGFFLFILWAAWTGNLIMGADEYERRRATLTAIMLLFIGCTGMIGALTIFLWNLLIDAVAKSLNDPKLLTVIVGLMLGALLGFFLAIFWASWNGDLVMGLDDYQRRKAFSSSTILIIVCTALIGGLLGLVRTRKIKKSHDNTNQI